MKPAFFTLFLFTSIVLSAQSETSPFKEGTHWPDEKEMYNQVLGKLDRLRAAYDVTYYNVEVEFKRYNRKIKSRVDIHAKALSTIDSLRFDLAQNLKIDSIYVNGQKVITEPEREIMAVRFLSPVTLPAQENFVIRIWYHGKPRYAKNPPWVGGFVKKKDRWSDPWMGMACESEGANMWLACKDHTSDEADSALLIYHLPENDLKAVGNGKKQDVVIVASDKKPETNTFIWKVTYPINTYNLTFYIGNFVPVEGTIQLQEGQLPYCHYVLKKDSARAARHFGQVNAMVHFFDSIYGPYPWINDGFKLIESPYEGMEHQTAIAIGDDLRNTYSKLNYNGMLGKFIMQMLINVVEMDTHSLKRYDYLVLHETAHEWWGNSVTANDFAHIWLQEGMATYSEILFIEHRFGQKAMKGALNFQGIQVQNKYPVIGATDCRDFSYKQGDVYNKASLTIHALREHLDNDSLFFRYLHDLYLHFQKQTTDSKAFLDFTNDYLGEDLTPFFSQYFLGIEIPKLKFNWKEKDGSSFLVYQWIGCEEGFKRRISITLEDGSKLRLSPTAEASELKLEKQSFSFNSLHALYTMYFE